MKIGVIGNYGATNIGDDAILTAILCQLQPHEVTIFSANPESWKASKGTSSAALFPLGFRSMWKYGFRSSYRALKELDAVILGGGGLFQDAYLFACFLWAWQIFWVKHLKKPLFIYATGVGPLRSRLGRRLSKWALGQADMITVRDSYSARLLEDLKIGRTVEIVADPAFHYKKPNICKSRTKNLFMINLRPWLNLDSRTIKTVGAVLDRLKQEKGADFIFVSMQQIKEHDMQVLKPVLRRVGGEVYFPAHFSDLLQMMETVDFAVGMRYHFMIAALITETPLLPIPYSPKTSSLFEGTPLAGLRCPVSELTEENLYGSLKKLSVTYNNTIIYERALVAEQAGLAEKNTALLQVFLKNIDPARKD